jgi:hypothetical protein
MNVTPGTNAADQTFTKEASGVGFHVSGNDGGFTAQTGYHASSLHNEQAATRAAPSILTGEAGIKIHAGATRR